MNILLQMQKRLEGENRGLEVGFWIDIFEM
jgi:hypothetical protein